MGRYFRYYRRLFLLTGFAVTLAGCAMFPLRHKTGKESQAILLNREGIAAFEREDYETAEKKFLHAMKNDENDLSSRRLYAEILWKKGETNQAFRVLIEASSLEGSTEEHFALNQSLAEKFHNIHQETAALNYAEKMTTLSPKRSEAWKIRGQINESLEKWDEALADYHKALSLAPNDQTSLRLLADLENRLGLYDRALAAWSELGRFYPNNEEPIDVLRGKGIAAEHLGYYRDAADYLTAAIQAAPDDTELYSLLIEAHLKNNDHEAAQEVTRQFARLYPQNREAQNLQNSMEQIGMADKSKKKY